MNKSVEDFHICWVGDHPSWKFHGIPFRVPIQVKLPPNPYNRGFWKNLSEVLWWEQHLQRAAAESAISAVMMKPKEAGADDAAGRQPGEQEDGLDHPIQGGALPQRLGNDHESAAAVGRQGQLSRRMKQK